MVERRFVAATRTDGSSLELAAAVEPRAARQFIDVGPLPRRAKGIRSAAHFRNDFGRRAEVKIHRLNFRPAVRLGNEREQPTRRASDETAVHAQLLNVVGAGFHELVGGHESGGRLHLDRKFAQDVDSPYEPVPAHPRLEHALGRQTRPEHSMKGAALVETRLPFGRNRDHGGRASIECRTQGDEVGDSDRPLATLRGKTVRDLSAEFCVLADPDGRFPRRNGGTLVRRHGPQRPSKYTTLRPGREVAIPRGPLEGNVADLTRRPLVVGTGIAGLYVALRCRELGLRPALITKSRLEEATTRYAQGGIAAAVGADDSPALHLEDTIRAGDGLVDLAAARALCYEAPARIADLVRYGVPFDTVEGQIALGREAAHSRARILHAGGDATGLSIEETLKRRVLDAGIEVRERIALRALKPTGRGGIIAVTSGEGGRAVEETEAGPVVLATGGAGSLYRQSSNPSVATGEGVAIAFRAGALLTDMEFVQFHPTVFWREGAPRFLITEAVRGEGAVLRNEAGERFLVGQHRDAELAPRDVVARAVDREIHRSGHPCVYLDATGIPRDRFYARFPSVCSFLATYGLDPSRDWIPVTPVAHYMIGGVTTDLEGRSSLRGLYACGEVASTGVHGANRLASNSLLEGLVFGERVARQLVHPVPAQPPPPGRLVRVDWPAGGGRDDTRGAVDRVRDILWDDVGIVRTGGGLRGALDELSGLGRSTEPGRSTDPPGPVANAVLTASLIARTALTRTESRGAHYRSDFPKRRPQWRLHIGLVRQEAREGRGSHRR